MSDIYIPKSGAPSTNTQIPSSITGKTPEQLAMEEAKQKELEEKAKANKREPLTNVDNPITDNTNNNPVDTSRYAGQDRTADANRGKTSWADNVVGSERFNTRSALKDTVSKYLGGYDWNNIERTPEMIETERLSRLADAVNRQFRVNAPTQMGNMSGSGRVTLAPADEGGVIQAQQPMTEDQKQQELMRALEAKRREWETGMGQEVFRYENEGELFNKAQAAMNNLAAQYDAGELQQTLLNLDLDKDSIAQVVSGFNEIRLQAEEWNSFVKQNMAKFAAGLGINEAIQRAEHIFKNAEDFLSFTVAMQILGGGLGIPGAADSMIGTLIMRMRDPPYMRVAKGK
jgi:hypothetical protein